MSVDETLTETRPVKLDHAEPYLNDYTGLGLTNSTTTETFEDTQEEQDLIQKLDKRILPITCLLYLFACSSSRTRSTLLLLT